MQVIAVYLTGEWERVGNRDYPEAHYTDSHTKWFEDESEFDEWYKEMELREKTEEENSNYHDRRFVFYVEAAIKGENLEELDV